MPTYNYECQQCDESFSLWRSIHADRLEEHPGCGGRVVQVMSAAALYGVGERGALTREVDARERRWDRDMGAYKRFRDAGRQPPGIDGCDRLEATAVSEFHIDSGIPASDQQVREAADIAREISAGRA